MEPTIKAILARFNGNRADAYEYCMRTSCALSAVNNIHGALDYWNIATENFG